MTRCILKPILREQGSINFSGELKNIESEQTYIAISTVPSKKYSFLVKIISINSENENEDISDYGKGELSIPILEVDSRRLGVLSENDTVDLYPYNIPVAERIEIAVIDEDYIGIPAGDWTSTFRPILIGKSLDLGDTINCAIETESLGTKSVILIKGILLDSHPKPPIKVGETTNCELKKGSKRKFRDLEENFEIKKAERTDLIKESISQKLTDIIGKIKTGQLEQSTETLNFQDIEGKSLNNLIGGIFTGFELFEERINEEESSFTCSCLYIVREHGEPSEIIEYQIASSGPVGTLMINVYTDSLDKSISIGNNLLTKFENLHYGVKKGTESQQKCPYCGMKLPKNQISANSLICESCGSEIRIGVKSNETEEKPVVEVQKEDNKKKSKKEKEKKKKKRMRVLG
ncbi:MAG: hypothetical protein GY870_00870 [archaeon]|nr:hypothetical protein [archaeon]